MTQIDLILQQTLTFRTKVGELLLSIPEEDRTRIPSGWNNHALWHAGHLLTTPRLLTLGLAGRELGMPSHWRKLFSKDSAPATWPDNPSIPSYGEMVGALGSTISEIVETLGPAISEPFANPYVTSTGVVLHSPAESLPFSFCHDGIHLGLILALRRALKQGA
jgi:hypothetical protein